MSLVPGQQYGIVYQSTGQEILNSVGEDLKKFLEPYLRDKKDKKITRSDLKEAKAGFLEDYLPSVIVHYRVLNNSHSIEPTDTTPPKFNKGDYFKTPDSQNAVNEDLNEMLTLLRTAKGELPVSRGRDHRRRPSAATTNAVPTGDILGLNDTDLMKFPPREEELKGLFGARRLRTAKKSGRKTGKKARKTRMLKSRRRY
jgi:hypothetical protein